MGCFAPVKLFCNFFGWQTRAQRPKRCRTEELEVG